MNNNPFLQCFPHTANIKHPRQIQIDCLNWLWDPLTKAKNNTVGLSWQDSQISRTIEQSYGRINRNSDKKTMTYIVDSNFNNLELGYWYHKNRRYFHQWFMEAEVGYNPILAKFNGMKIEAMAEEK